MQSFLIRIRPRIRALGIRARLSRHRSGLISLAVHAVLLLCLVGGIRLAPRMAPYRLPGTQKGVTFLTYYQSGSRQPVAAETLRKKPQKPKPTAIPVPSVPKLDPSHAAGSQAGVGSSAQSGLGEGDITLALETYFPFPTPDLTVLPHGTKGDVILDAVVDEHGNISQLTLLKGLGSAVDDSVIATVRQWKYTPAMRQGVPVASERELHFHYERG